MLLQKRGGNMKKMLQFLKTKTKLLLIIFKKLLPKLLSIRVKLFIGLLIPVVMLGIYGLKSYQMSEKAIISNYEKSSAGTLNLVSDYLGFGFNIIEEKTQ